jgi:hypothetical protein
MLWDKQGADDSRGSLESQCTGRVPQEFAGCRIDAITAHPLDTPFQILSAKGKGVQFGSSQALSEFRSIQFGVWDRKSGSLTSDLSVEIWSESQ